MAAAFRIRRRLVAMSALVGCLGLVAASLAFGDATGPQFRITNQGHDGDSSYYARTQDTAYDSQTNQHLVVFFNQDELALGDVQGQFVDAAGNLVGSAFQISPLGVDEEPPSVTYNATNNEFLVGWYTGDGLQAQRVSASGTLLGSVIPVSSEPYNDIETLDLAWSPEGNEYLVGWKADGAGGEQVYGRRIGADGTPLDATDLQISHVPQGSEADDAMALTYNTTAHEFMVVYRGWNYDQAPDGEYEVWGQRVALDGSDVGPADFRISHTGSDTDQTYRRAGRPQVAYDASRNQYLVTFMNNVVVPNGDVEVFGQFVAANGDMVGSTFQISNIGNGQASFGVNGPDVVYDQFGDVYLVVFQGSPATGNSGTNSNAEIYGDYVTGAGAVTGTRDFPISDMGSSSNPALAGLRPSVAFNSQTCAFMANWFGDTTQEGLVNNEWEVWGRLVTAPPCPPPTATTGNATDVTQTSATLNGTANAKGHSATYHFEYGTSTSYGSTTPQQSVGSDMADHAESAAISGLAPGTTYHFRIVVTNAYGTTAGADQVFTTASPAVAAAVQKPTVTTGRARVTATSARLGGSVNPHGTSTMYHFQFGRTTKYGRTTPANSAGSGNAQVVAGARISGLKPGVTYHYRLVATNSAGTAVGADRVFTTSPRLLLRGVRSGCTTSAFRVHLGVTSAIAVRSVRVYVDGQRIASTTRKQLSVMVRSLRPGRHTVRVVVTPRRGSSVVRSVTYRACRAPTFTG